jgi:hypothetical protein
MPSMAILVHLVFLIFIEEEVHVVVVATHLILFQLNIYTVCPKSSVNGTRKKRKKQIQTN